MEKKEKKKSKNEKEEKWEKKKEEKLAIFCKSNPQTSCCSLKEAVAKQIKLCVNCAAFEKCCRSSVCIEISKYLFMCPWGVCGCLERKTLLAH